MTRRSAGITIAAALVGVLFAVVTTSGGVNLWIEPQWEPTPPPINTQQIEVPSAPAAEFEESADSDRAPFQLPGWLRALLNVLGVAAMIAALAALAVAGWNRRPRLRWRRRSAADDFEVLPDVAAAVVAEAANQRAALQSGSARNAIVRCWLRLEHDVAAAGLERHRADTSAEFTERVLARYSVDTDAIHHLASLYREARFSEHPLDEESRRSALEALDRLHQALVATSEAADNPLASSHEARR